jgi:hypothetical protein
VHSEERAISLSLKLLLLLCQTSLARDRFQVRNSVRPMHLFGHTFDPDYYFELPRKGERDAQSITRCSAAHLGDFRAVPRANRTFSTARNPKSARCCLHEGGRGLLRLVVAVHPGCTSLGLGILFHSRPMPTTAAAWFGATLGQRLNTNRAWQPFCGTFSVREHKAKVNRTEGS